MTAEKEGTMGCSAAEESSRGDLRQRAESSLIRKPLKRAEPRDRDMDRLVHELEVHQVELEMQNEELRKAQTEIAESRDRYHTLYDLAPVVHLTLDPRGAIREANLAAAGLLGIERGRLLGRPLASMMTEEDANSLHRHLQEVFEAGTKKGCDLRIQAAGGAREIAVHIESIAFSDENGKRSECRSVVIDLSDLRDAQARGQTWEDRNRTLLDTAADAIVSSDSSGRIEAFNQAAERLFGYKEEEVLGKNVRMLMPAPYRGEHDQYIHRYVATAEARIIGRTNREVTGLKKDGTTFPLELGIGEWWDHGERKFTAIIHDVTDRKRAENEIRQSAERYAVIFERSPFAIALTKMPEGTLVGVNDAFLRLFEYTREEVLGRGGVDLGIADPDSHARVCRELSERGSVRDFECMRRTRSGKELILSLSLDWVTLGGQEHVLTTIRDVTEHRQADQHLRESEARFRQIAEHVDDVFALHDREHRQVTYVSPAFEIVWGRSASDLYDIGTGWIEWVHPDDRERLAQAYECMLKGDPFDEEHRIVRPDGDARWVRTRTFPIEESSGDVRRDVIVVQDITNERELEEELRQAQKMEAVGALASGVAHDFNNVLQAVLGCVNVARTLGPLPEKADHYLERAAKATRRGGDLAGQLMAFTRKQRANPRPLAIDATITGVAALLERLVTEQVTLDIQAGAPEKTILADPVQVEQILMNLAANARDAMPEGGTLSIRTKAIDWNDAVARRHGLKKAGRYVCLVVEDSGTGMDERTRHRIFEPFFTTKQLGKGTGLGLSTVFAVTRQLGGHIDVDSEPGQGTRFTLYFPCHEERAFEPSSQEPEVARFQGTALLVEDEPLVRMTVHHYLDALGLDVLEAQGVAEAQDVCERHRGSVDLLVSDVILPIMRGPKLAELLKQRYPDLRVLFISANPAFAGEEKLTMGKTPVLQKPFGKEDLAGKLKELLDGDVAGAPAAPPHREIDCRRTRACDTAARPAASATILLVEDEPASRLALGDMLQSEGYRVLVAERPSKALEAVARHAGTIDLLLSDVRLPEMGGEALARRLRQSYPGLRVVFMSGLPDPPDEASAFVQKPIDFDDLVKVVKRTLAHASDTSGRDS